MEAYLTGQYSQQKICETFKIRSRTQLRAWLKVYNSGRDFKRMSGGSPDACSVIWVLLRQWKSTGWHLLRKKSAKSRTLLAAKILFYFIVLLTGCGSFSIYLRIDSMRRSAKRENHGSFSLFWLKSRKINVTNMSERIIMILCYLSKHAIAQRAKSQLLPWMLPTSGMEV